MFPLSLRPFSNSRDYLRINFQCYNQIYKTTCSTEIMDIESDKDSGFSSSPIESTCYDTTSLWQLEPNTQTAKPNEFNEENIRVSKLAKKINFVIEEDWDLDNEWINYQTEKKATMKRPLKRRSNGNILDRHEEQSISDRESSTSLQNKVKRFR